MLGQGQRGLPAINLRFEDEEEDLIFLAGDPENIFSPPRGAKLVVKVEAEGNDEWGWGDPSVLRSS